MKTLSLPHLSAWRMIEFHRTLLSEKGRCESYRRALLDTVKKGDVVMDIGSGTGVLSFFACQAGAKKVYAVEAGGVIELSKKIFEGSDYEDRVVFLNDFSYRLKRLEPVDVLVTDTFESFGFNGGILGSVLDARRRFLKKNGAIIPQSIEIFIAPVELPGLYKKINFWKNNRYGMNLSKIGSFVANQFYPIKPNLLGPSALLSEPRSIAHVDLSKIRTSDVYGEASFVIKQKSTLHGIAGWFSAELSKGVSMSNAPDVMNPKWNNLFFPLEEPLSLKKGDRIHIIIEAKANGDIWRWQVAAPRLGASYDQSNFWGWPLTNGKQS